MIKGVDWGAAPPYIAGPFVTIGDKQYLLTNKSKLELVATRSDVPIQGEFDLTIVDEERGEQEGVTARS